MSTVSENQLKTRQPRLPGRTRTAATSTSKSTPPTWSGHAPGLAERLRAEIRGEVRFDDGARALYATDASNYRMPPIGVVIPRDRDDIIATVRLCHEHGAPLLSRGGGTSLAGQCCNTAVVMDLSKYYNRVLSIDAPNRLATVEPGIVLDELQKAARPHGLIFGPNPATHNHCTLGGMLGNNSCGINSLLAANHGHGLRTSDNVAELEVLTYDGTILRLGQRPTTSFPPTPPRRAGTVKSTRRSTSSARATPASSASVSRKSRAASPATTSTTFSPKTAPISPARSSAPKARASSSSPPRCTLSRVPPPARSSCSAMPTPSTPRST
jgi:FAD/FMN-containing dehydrogenase